MRASDRAQPQGLRAAAARLLGSGRPGCLRPAARAVTARGSQEVVPPRPDGEGGGSRAFSAERREDGGRKASSLTGFLLNECICGFLKEQFGGSVQVQSKRRLKMRGGDINEKHLIKQQQGVFLRKKKKAAAGNSSHFSINKSENWCRLIII